MKLSSFAVLASAFTAATATSIRSPSAKASLLSKSRRLENQNQNQNQYNDEEYGFLANYALKLVGCSAGETWMNQDGGGEMEYSSVVYRLCPKDECDDDSSTGCKSDFGDYVVGINTFVDAWLEDKRENMQQDDNFNIDEFSECREYENQNDYGDNNNNGQVYYVGPTCDGDAGVKLGFFSDYMCTKTPEDVTFEDISYGWTLPYSSGGLIGSGCEDCYGYNNGNYELKEMCTQLYEWSGKCETEMENGGYYKNEYQCDTIHEIAPATSSSSGSGVGAAIGWTILVVAVLAGAFFAYTKWWLKRKESTADLSASDGAVA